MANAFTKICAVGKLAQIKVTLADAVVYEKSPPVHLVELQLLAVCVLFKVGKKLSEFSIPLLGVIPVTSLLVFILVDEMCFKLIVEQLEVEFLAEGDHAFV